MALDLFIILPFVVEIFWPFEANQIFVVQPAPVCRSIAVVAVVVVVVPTATVAKCTLCRHHLVALKKGLNLLCTRCV